MNKTPPSRSSHRPYTRTLSRKCRRRVGPALEDPYSHASMKNYRSLEVHQYFQSGWVETVPAKDCLWPHCPSWLNDPTHSPWVAASLLLTAPAWLDCLEEEAAVQCERYGNNLCTPMKEDCFTLQASYMHPIPYSWHILLVLLLSLMLHLLLGASTLLSGLFSPSFVIHYSIILPLYFSISPQTLSSLGAFAKFTLFCTALTFSLFPHSVHS